MNSLVAMKISIKAMITMITANKWNQIEIHLNYAVIKMLNVFT